LFGPYIGSDIIGLTEIAAAILIIAGYVRPKAGIIRGFITTLMFFITSTKVVTTPGAVIAVHGMRYMSFLGLFLFKDVISLGVSFYLSAISAKGLSFPRTTNMKHTDHGKVQSVSPDQFFLGMRLIERSTRRLRVTDPRS
jgi:hypothetical protein